MYDHVTSKIEGIQLERITNLKPGQSMKDLPESLHHESFRRRANRRIMDGTPTEKRGGAPSGIKRLIFDEPSLTITRVSNLKYESLRIDFKTVVFIRANPGKKETTDGSGSHVIFIQKQCTFPEVVSPEKWYVTNIKPWA